MGRLTRMQTLPSINSHLYNALIPHLIPPTRYDVWLVDWRVSCNLPSMIQGDYTLDDCAAYDYPAAINKVIEITKQVCSPIPKKGQPRCSLENLKRTPKRCQDPVLWAWLEMFVTPKRYQF